MSKRELFKVEDKLFIRFKNKKGEEEQRELVISENSFKGEPEEVAVNIGITLSPKQYESIRVDYYCKIHHQPGDKFREDAFDKAYFACTNKIEEHVMDLYQSKIIKDTSIVSPEDKNIFQQENYDFPVIATKEEEEVKAEEEPVEEQVKEERPKRKKK